MSLPSMEQQKAELDITIDLVNLAQGNAELAEKTLFFCYFWWGFSVHFDFSKDEFILLNNVKRACRVFAMPLLKNRSLYTEHTSFGHFKITIINIVAILNQRGYVDDLKRYINIFNFYQQSQQSFPQDILSKILDSPIKTNMIEMFWEARKNLEDTYFVLLDNIKKLDGAVQAQTQALHTPEPVKKEELSLFGTVPFNSSHIVILTNKVICYHEVHMRLYDSSFPNKIYSLGVDELKDFQAVISANEHYLIITGIEYGQPRLIILDLHSNEPKVSSLLSSGFLYAHPTQGIFLFSIPGEVFTVNCTSGALTFIKKLLSTNVKQASFHDGQWHIISVTPNIAFSRYDSEWSLLEHRVLAISATKTTLMADHSSKAIYWKTYVLTRYGIMSGDVKEIDARMISAYTVINDDEVLIAYQDQRLQRYSFYKAQVIKEWLLSEVIQLITVRHFADTSLAYFTTKGNSLYRLELDNNKLEPSALTTFGAIATAADDSAVLV